MLVGRDRVGAEHDLPLAPTRATSTRTGRPPDDDRCRPTCSPARTDCGQQYPVTGTRADPNVSPMSTRPEDVGMSSERSTAVASPTPTSTRASRPGPDDDQPARRAVHHDCYGFTDVATQAGGHPGHDLPDLLDDQAHHERRPDDAVRGGSLPPRTRCTATCPSSPTSRCGTVAPPTPQTRPPAMTVHDVLTHLGPDLRVRLPAPARRAVPGQRTRRLQRADLRPRGRGRAELFYKAWTCTCWNCSMSNDVQAC